MPRIAALLGATALLSGVIVWLPIEASATISINDSFANSTTDASVVGASNGSTDAAGQPFPCLTAR